MENPLVEITGYKKLDFMYIDHLFGTIDAELVGISHVSLTTGRLLRGAGFVRCSDLAHRVTNIKNARAMLLDMKHEAANVS